MLEGLPNGQGPFVKVATGVSESDFPASATVSPTSASNTDRPATITDDDIQKVMEIFDAVQRKTINEKEAERRLQAVVNGRDPALLAWIVRRVPIYDGQSRGWVSFARYEDQTLMTFNLSSELDLDPVKTTLAILFGKYKDSAQEFQAMGCGGG